MDVRGTHPHRIREDGLQQPHHRRVFRARRQRHLAQVDRALEVAAEVALELARQARDLGSPAEKPVDRCEQLRFLDHRHLDGAVERALDLGERIHVERIDEAHHHRVGVTATVLTDRQHPQPPHLRLGQAPRGLGLDLGAAQVDVVHPQLARQGHRQAALAQQPLADQDLAQAHAGTALLGERGFELLGREDALLDEQFA